jgi:5'-methylthioadenosine phosphorylase
MKRAGVTDLVSFSACGSFREELSPGTFVLVDNFIDRTVRRESSFFGAGCVAHVPFAHPVGPALQDLVARAAENEGIPYRRGGTAVCMEGPQFSTLAESLAYRGAGYDVIHMTSMPEAKLAREAEITYAVVCMVTDYDCWHTSHETVDIQMVLQNLLTNAAHARELVRRALPAVAAAPRDEAIAAVSRDAVITAPEHRSAAAVARLKGVIDGL